MAGGDCMYAPLEQDIEKPPTGKLLYIVHFYFLIYFYTHENS